MDMMRWTFPYPDQCTSELQDKQIDIIQDKKHRIDKIQDAFPPSYVRYFLEKIL